MGILNHERRTTTRYDVAEHLRTPEEMAAYLEACFEESKGDAAFVAKALGDIARAKGKAKAYQVKQILRAIERLEYEGHSK